MSTEPRGMADVELEPQWVGCATPPSMCGRCKRFGEERGDGGWRCRMCGVSWWAVEEGEEE
jgi:tRNA(Ile2) C34 agmatinyltransferase TiaS